LLCEYPKDYRGDQSYYEEGRRDQSGRSTEQYELAQQQLDTIAGHGSTDADTDQTYPTLSEPIQQVHDQGARDGSSEGKEDDIGEYGAGDQTLAQYLQDRQHDIFAILEDSQTDDERKVRQADTHEGDWFGYEVFNCGKEEGEGS
jgi:hypothetical protein